MKLVYFLCGCLAHQGFEKSVILGMAEKNKWEMNTVLLYCIIGSTLLCKHRASLEEGDEARLMNSAEYSYKQNGSRNFSPHANLLCS